MNNKLLKSAVLCVFSIFLWQCTEGESTECPAGKEMCGHECVNLYTDPLNCGSCGNRCATGEVCLSGTCTRSEECPTGLTYCGGECVDTNYNPNHCGGCGAACQPGQSCNAGICVGGACPPGQTDCPGYGCVDLRSNPDNCGACGNSCEGAACYDGACTSECPTGMTMCSGICVDLTKDEDNCGSCGNACAAGQVCEGGSCMLLCPEGFTDCGGVCVNTQSDHDNCGTCGNACSADEVCVSGACRTGGCPSPLTDCGGSCVDTSTDEDNCGSCGNRCADGESCVDGSCGIVCPPGQTLCSGRCVDTSTDESNCGSCGNTCRADQVCSSGSCRCPSGLTECAGACVDTTIDPSNCGSCGNECEGAEACVSGSCSLNCPSGQTACDGYCVDTTSDRHHCGSCGNECATDETCIGGTCQTSAVCTADSCSTAIDVSGGGRFTGSTTCAGDDYSGSCGGSAGRELVFRFTTTSSQDVFISTHGSSFDTVIYVRRSVCDSGSDTNCNDDEHGALQSELNMVDLAAGTYYIFLDGYFSSSYGDYVLDVYMTDPAFEGDRCGDPEYFDVSSATELSGDTCPWYWFDANPDTEGCRGLPEGKDRVYYFIVRYSPMTVTFATCDGTSWDTVLYVRSVCNDRAAEVACDDDGCSSGLQSELTATFDPGIYYLWLDGYSGSACGGYRITVSR